MRINNKCLAFIVTIRQLKSHSIARNFSYIGLRICQGDSEHLAQARSEARARRPKTGKLAGCRELCATVEGLLRKRYSPEQIAGVLTLTYPDRAEMQVSHETIYKALYVQGRGGLRRELTQCLRTGRALRKPRGRMEEPSLVFRFS